MDPKLSRAMIQSSKKLARRLGQTRSQLRQSHTYAQKAQHERSGLVLKALLGIAVGAATFHGAKRLGATPAYAESKSTLQKEEKRSELSSQHVQVMRSWEKPGLYLWGSNTGNVTAPDSDEKWVKTPRRLPYFDGMLLRDLKLDRNVAVAINEKGDLIQWGTGYSKDAKKPVVTLTGRNLVSVVLSKDRITALSAKGTVYSIPISQVEQENEPKIQEESWIPFWSSTPQIGYKKFKLPLGYSEQVVSIKGGLEHVLLLTSAGRVFSAASSSESFPSRGELGVPGISWAHRAHGDEDHLHEVTTLRGFNITEIAAGDYHSVVLDDMGRVFSFGDNSFGQCGFDYNFESPSLPSPTLVPIERVYMGSGSIPRVTGIAAGGMNTFFSVDATKNAPPAPDGRLQVGRISADVLACGQGIYGSLGNGRWTHIQGEPMKVKSLSGLFEYSEQSNSVVPIRVAHLSVGATHTAAILDNITHINAHKGSSENDTNWGADVLLWGGNEFYQLGTGRRNNQNTPTYISPLDPESSDILEKRQEHRFQITPRKTINLNGRSVSMKQKIECGRGVSGVFSGV
jgi:alpha-tubulin suppressor-like RCC1 family protein